MDYKQLRIVFMGTPEFAVASLEALIKSNCNIVAVVTAPDKPAGRGMKLTESAVKKCAVTHQIPVLQPLKLKDPAFIEELKSFNAHIHIVVAFRMLPEMVWNMPPMGTINVHGSLLPQYRGAAPINWAIINGEKETGVTTFKLKHEIDTGDILLQNKIIIHETETCGQLHDRMKEVGAATLVQTIQQIAENNLAETPQSNLISNIGNLQHAPKIFTETCTINWHQPIDKIYNLIRGLSPYPGAFTYLNGKMLKIFFAEKEYATVKDVPGQVVTDKKNFLKFCGNDGYLLLKDVQLEGKKRMPITDFLRGYNW